MGDLNDDGLPDIAAVIEGNTISVLLNTTTPGAGTASFSAKQDFLVGDWPVSLAIDDLDGDGRDDLAVCYIGHYIADGYNNVSVLLNTTTSGATTVSFADRQDFPASSYARSRALAIEDLNADGYPDLAVATYPSYFEPRHKLAVLLNTPIMIHDYGAEGKAGVGTIVNDDGPPATVTLGAVTADASGVFSENGGTGAFTATLSKAVGQDVTVWLSFYGTGNATLDTDFVVSAQSIVVPAGSLSGSITVTALDDSLYEGSVTGGGESIIVGPSAVANGTISGSGAGLHISDDDPPPTVTLDVMGSPL
ncbi:MAG: FG-GAP-like repeat-containing protein, partial [Planctomycetota bacterium]